METLEQITARGSIQGAGGTQYKLGSQEATDYLLGKSSSVAPGTNATGTAVGTVTGKDANGRYSSNYRNATNPTGMDYKPQKKDVVPSTALTAGMTVTDLMSRRNTIFQDYLTASKPSDLEGNLTSQLNSAKKLSRSAELDYLDEKRRLQENGSATKDQSTAFLSETSRRYSDEFARQGIGMSGLADALNAEVKKREVTVDGLKTQMNFDKDTMGLLKDLQAMTKPDVIGSPQVNEMTGEVTVFKQDPQTGEITAQILGNVGASKKYIQTGTRTDSEGNDVFWGVRADGTIESTILGAGEGDDTKFQSVKGDDGRFYNFNPATGEYTATEFGGMSAPGETPILTPKEARDLNNELVKNGNYLALNKARVSQDALSAFEEKFNKYGTGLVPGKKKAELAAAYNGAILNLKEFFNLGVLNGPDQAILEKILINPTSFSNPLDYAQKKTQVRASINVMKQQLNEKLDSDYASISAQYGQYGEDQITNMKDVNKKYVEAKKMIDPNVQQMVKDNPGLTNDDILQVLQPDTVSFNSVGGDTNIASIKRKIASVESGNRYDALSPVNKNGNRAYGKYQIMAENIPSWTKEALGRSMTPQEFLKNPQAQEKTAEFQLAKIYKKYGNADDVAAVWFSGRPLKGNNSKDVTGTSVPQYVKRFNQA